MGDVTGGCNLLTYHRMITVPRDELLGEGKT